MEKIRQFKNENEPALTLGGLQSRFDIEFEEYRRGRKESVRKDFEKNSEPNEANDIIKRIDEELNEANLESKVMKFLGNFSCWFPGGYYRDLKLSENESIRNKERFEYNKKIAEDLDEAIRECGYVSEAAIIGNNGIIDKNLRAKVLLEIYFKMKEKGYNNRELST